MLFSKYFILLGFLNGTYKIIGVLLNSVHSTMASAPHTAAASCTSRHFIMAVLFFWTVLY